MIIESKIDFQPAEVEDLFNAIVGVALKVKAGMDLDRSVRSARIERDHAHEKADSLREQYEERIKEMRSDHQAEVVDLKKQINDLKSKLGKIQTEDFKKKADEILGHK